jgi:hypothetical protein
MRKRSLARQRGDKAADFRAFVVPGRRRLHKPDGKAGIAGNALNIVLRMRVTHVASDNVAFAIAALGREGKYAIARNATRYLRE